MAEPITAPMTAAFAGERQAQQLFCSEVSEAMVELARHYRLEVQRSAIASDPIELVGHQVAGIIGFAGPGFGGTLAIRAPSMVVRSCLPIAVRDPDITVLGDWIAELANQLVGRTKNKLIRYRTTFQITPPTYAIADELLVLGCDRARTSWISFSTNVGALLVMVELHASADFALMPAEPEGVVAHAEGELLLF